MILGASFDTPEENREFSDKYGFGFPLLSDVDHSVGRSYGSEKGPDEQWPDFPKRVTFLIDPDGQVAKVYEVTDVGTHPDEVLADLQALASTP